MNFSLAAQHLHISQPALHTKIRKLCDSLGVPLYVRQGRVIQLTVHGESVARFGREVSARTLQFCSMLNGDGHESVVLAAGEGAYMYLLGKGIRAFLRHSETALSLLTADRDRAIQLVREGRANLGVAPLDSIPADILAVPLCTVGQVLVVPAGHALYSRKSLKLKDLSGCALVIPPEGRPQRQMLSSVLQSANVPWSIAVEASGWELMIQFVQAGMGVTVVNACCRIPKGVKAIPIPELPKLHYHLFSMRAALARLEVARLASHLQVHASDWKKG